VIEALGTTLTDATATPTPFPAPPPTSKDRHSLALALLASLLQSVPPANQAAKQHLLTAEIPFFLPAAVKNVKPLQF
jgi:hypothetical protein